MFTGEMSPSHWLIVAVVALLLFGSKKMPDAARSLGRSLRILKAEMSKVGDDEAGGGAVSAPPPEERPVG
ncbi:Sec-independent protein translocase subunit TatA [Nonomuraea sp. NPDC005650]|uniref:Sec-independent protein translocase subunit TatA n=1 Tax=Nonomuraea sp. NPDC005650 TaxID=3157045 RepID=UPI0033A80305